MHLLTDTLYSLLQQRHTIWHQLDARIQRLSLCILYSHAVSRASFFSVFLVASLSPLLSPRVYMFALGKGGNEGESCSEQTLCNTFQRPTLLYPKLCLCQALKCDWTSFHCCILKSLHDFFSQLYLL